MNGRYGHLFCWLPKWSQVSDDNCAMIDSSRAIGNSAEGTTAFLSRGGRTKMTASDAPESKDEQGRPLYVSIEMVANLVYLARHSEEGLDQRLYLDRASDLLFETRHHPDLPR